LKPTLSAKLTHGCGAYEPRALAGRVLIVLTALLIAVIPWTEYYWDFDNFLHGGQDFELGLLATITVFCLVLVLLQHNKQGVTFWFALRRWLSVSLLYHDPAFPTLSSRSVMASFAVPLPDPQSGLCDLPLRI
jgi:cytochrome bd-type quinol oxidase subunit 2